MNSSNNKGKLIYDDWTIPKMRKKIIRWRRTDFWLGGIGVLCIAIFLISSPYIINVSIYFSLIGIILIFVSIWGILTSFCYETLKIYENGIILPEKNILGNKENYIQFSDIKLVYISPKNFSDELIIFLKHNGKGVRFYKKEIYSTNKLENLLNKKVEITKDFKYFQKIKNQLQFLDRG